MFRGVLPQRINEDVDVRQDHFEAAIEALDVFEVFHLLDGGVVADVDVGVKATGGGTYARQLPLTGHFLRLSHHQPQTVLDQRGQRAAFRRRLAAGAVQELLGEADGGAFDHMSGDMVDMSVCQFGDGVPEGS